MMLISFMMVALLMASLPALGVSSPDYKVIKNALKTKGGSGEINWFKVQITDKKTKKTTVKITLPISIIEMLADSSDGDLKIKDKCEINLKKVIADLKKHGPMTLLEVDEDDESIRIWFE